MKAKIIVSHSRHGVGGLSIDVIGNDGKTVVLDRRAGSVADPSEAAAMAVSYAAGYTAGGYMIIAPKAVMDLIPREAQAQEAAGNP